MLQTVSRVSFLFSALSSVRRLRGSATRKGPAAVGQPGLFRARRVAQQRMGSCVVAAILNPDTWVWKMSQSPRAMMSLWFP